MKSELELDVVAAIAMPRRVDGVRGAVQPATRRWRQPTTTTQATLEVTIAEGRNRQIRRLAARADLKVTGLHRVRLGR